MMESQRFYLEPIKEYCEEEEEEEDADDWSHSDTADDVSEIEDDQCNRNPLSGVDHTEDLMIWEKLLSESSSSFSEVRKHEKVNELKVVSYLRKKKTK